MPFVWQQRVAVLPPQLLVGLFIKPHTILLMRVNSIERGSWLLVPLLLPQCVPLL